MTELVEKSSIVEKNSNSEYSAEDLHGILENIAEAKGYIMESLDQLIGNNEQIEQLNEQTEQLAQAGVEFKKGSSKLRKRYWWEKYKVPIMVGSGITVTGVVTTLIFVL